MNNRDTLIELMVTHRLERLDLATLLRVDRETVDRWLLPRDAARWCEIPDMALELLGYKLRERTVTTTDGPDSAG